MSFGGHVFDMLNRIKQNNALKGNRRKKFKGGNDYSKTKNIKTEFDLPKLSEEELSSLKNKIKKEVLDEKRKQLFYIILSIIITFILISSFSYFY